MDVLLDLVANASHLVGALVSHFDGVAATFLHVGFKVSDEAFEVQFDLVVFVLDLYGLVFLVYHFFLVKTVRRVDLLHVELEFVFITNDNSESVNLCLFLVEFHIEGRKVHDSAVPISVELGF